VDEAIIVIDKPAGLPVLPDGWEPDAPYLVNLLEDQFGSHSDGLGQGIWIVHRLDKTTSGVMVFARTADAHRDLNMQFEHHEAGKIYHAILAGSPPWEEKIAKHPLRLNVGHKHRTAVDPGHGKPAETRFAVLKRYRSYTLIQAVLMTGRTHQIRVHLAAVHHPIAGDNKYGNPELNRQLKYQGLKRMFLPSARLEIRHPLTGAELKIEAPLPADLQGFLDTL